MYFDGICQTLTNGYQTIICYIYINTGHSYKYRKNINITIYKGINIWVIDLSNP